MDEMKFQEVTRNYKEKLTFHEKLIIFNES